MSNILHRLQAICGENNILTDEPMKKHTTFRIGGPARVFAIPHSEEEIRDCIAACKEEGEDFFILGNGSNLLVGDGGIDGVVIRLFDNFNNIEITDDTLYAGAGALLSRVSNMAASKGLSGLEAASGIPGTIGGAVVMNAGAYGFEMKDVVVSVRVLTDDGEIEEIPGDEMEFGYRTSLVLKKGLTVLGAKLKLIPGKEEDIRARMRELKEQRTAKQPLEYPSAGSTFKRPEGYFAGKLIMDAGLRGYCVGDAQVSEKHCGFVINKGNATARDVLDLIEDVKNKVYEHDGVTLEPEIKMIGKF